jgi:hypothetical protein
MNPKSEWKKMDVSRERLSFTIYNILRQLDPKKDGYISLTRFHKIAYLVHRDVQKKYGINTGLPWHWYLFGPVVELSECPSEVYELKGYQGEEQRVFFHSTPRAGKVPESEKRAILEVIDGWRDRYLKTPQIVDIVYGDLEVGFLKELKDLESAIGNLPKDGLVPPSALLSELDRIRDLYPQEDYEESFAAFLRLDDLIRVLAESGPEALLSYQHLVVDFRKVIVQKAAAIYCENLGDDWRRAQNAEYFSQLDEFRCSLSEAERQVFTSVYRKREDKHGYSKRLMELSWENYLEG